MGGALGCVDWVCVCREEFDVGLAVLVEYGWLGGLGWVSGV